MSGINVVPIKVPLGEVKWVVVEGENDTIHVLPAIGGGKKHTISVISCWCDPFLDDEGCWVHNPDAQRKLDLQ